MNARKVSIPGLDLMLGGELPLVSRAAGKPAMASVLVRGGPGVGKTVLATYLATKIASQLLGDVLYACVEILPIELQEQQRRLSAATSTSDVRTPPWKTDSAPSDRPRIFASALELGDRVDPVRTQELFRAAIPELVDDVARLADCPPRVLVVDSLSAGYGLSGPNAPRLLADDLCKYAADQGIVLVAIEEASDPAPSIWSYAVDVVLEIDDELAAGGGRLFRVPKNRFGAATPGRAEFDIDSGADPRISPPPDAYMRLPIQTRKHGPEWGIPDLDSRPEWSLRFGDLVLVDGDRSLNFVMDWVHSYGPSLLIQATGVDRFFAWTETAKLRVHNHGLPVLSVEQILARTMDELRSSKQLRGLFFSIPFTMPEHLGARLAWLTAGLAHIARQNSCIMVLAQVGEPTWRSLLRQQADVLLHLSSTDNNNKYLIGAWRAGHTTQFEVPSPWKTA